jgi:ferredoxin
MTAGDEALVSAFGMPGFLVPWADRFFEPLELRLIETLAAGPLPAVELLARVPGLSPDDLARAYRRWVVNLEGDDPSDAAAAVTLADFAARFDVWAMFEGWKDVPADVAERLSDWELEHYVARVAPDVAALRDGHDRSGPEADLSYLLLEEAEAVLGAAPRVYLRPCDCRAMFRRCHKPRNVCLGTDNERGLGWEISRERAVEILREADAAGLMHTGIAGRAAGEAGWICNCCTDCCFPHLAAERLGVAAVWPRRRHRAEVAAAACTLCGRCVRRCPFAALSRGDTTTDAAEVAVSASAEPGAAAAGRRQSLLFSAELCRGCGLCASGCPEGAIVMKPLAASAVRAG